MPELTPEDAAHLAEIRDLAAQCLEFGWEVDMFSTDSVIFLLRLLDGPAAGGSMEP